LAMSIRLSPATSESNKIVTTTTNTMPPAVARVVILRTRRLRKLYLRGMAIGWLMADGRWLMVGAICQRANAVSGPYALCLYAICRNAAATLRRAAPREGITPAKMPTNNARNNPWIMTDIGMMNIAMGPRNGDQVLFPAFRMTYANPAPIPP